MATAAPLALDTSSAQKRMMKTKKRDVIKIERDASIAASRSAIVAQFTSLLDDPQLRQGFQELAARIDAAVRAWYLAQTEELLDDYSWFEPLKGAARLQQLSVTPAQADAYEQRFLKNLWQVMNKCNFKLVTNDTIAVAQDTKYLLQFPVEPDVTKIDDKMLSSFWQNNPELSSDRPQFSDRFLMFRRGVGIDRTTDMFIMDKLNTIVARAFANALKLLRGVMVQTKSGAHIVPPPDVSQLPARQGLQAPAGTGADDDENIVVERVRVENMQFTPKNLLLPATVQEPTFERMVVVYRKATPQPTSTHTKPPEQDRAIYIKHFRDIPMADMEIVLPEKKVPGLSAFDMLKLVGSAGSGLAALLVGQQWEMDFKVVVGIFIAFLSYCARIYFMWAGAQRIYMNVVNSTMYEKQLDSGRSTLLRLCHDVVQQEAKEVLVAYFCLLLSGPADARELDKRCEDILARHLRERTNFDVEDALDKLKKLQLVSQGVGGKHYALPIPMALQKLDNTRSEIQHEVRNAIDRAVAETPAL
eukprot:jgi/Chlat1/8681/Chrsp88S00667